MHGSTEIEPLAATQAPGSCELTPMAGANALLEPGAPAREPIARVGFELEFGRGIEYPMPSANFQVIEADKSVKEVVYDAIRPAAEKQLKTKASPGFRIVRGMFTKPCIREASVNVSNIFSRSLFLVLANIRYFRLTSTSKA